MYRRWICKHKSVPTKSIARTVRFSRFTAVTCCNPVLASFPIPMDTNLQIERRCARGSRAIVCSTVTDGRILRTLWFEFRAQPVSVPLRKREASLQVDCISVNKDHLHAIKSVIFQRLRVILYLDRYCNKKVDRTKITEIDITSRINNL